MGAHLTWGIIAGSLLLALFADLAEDVMYQETGAFDTVVGSFIRSTASEGLTQLAVIVTNVGSAAFEISLLLILGIYMFFRLKQVWEPLLLAVCLAGGWLLNTVLKEVFHRSRPDIQHLVAAGGYSFPSGHAMGAMVFYGLLAYWLWHDNPMRTPRVVVSVTFPVIVVLVGLSRIYLGVHYPSDVVGGYAAGLAWLALTISGMEILRAWHRKRQAQPNT